MQLNKSDASFFNAKYEIADDPWNFATSRYELDRYETIVGSLRPKIFRRAFEPACSIGILTEKLAGFCGQVEANDCAQKAVGLALKRCSRLANVEVRYGCLEDVRLVGTYDLIVLSEAGYYFDVALLASIGNRLTSHLEPGGVLLGAHWTGNSADHILSGDEVHGVLDGLPGLTVSFAQRFAGYRISHWIKQ